MFAFEDDEPNVVIELDSEVDLKQKLDSEVKQFLNIRMNADEKVKCNDNVVRDRSSKLLSTNVNKWKNMDKGENEDFCDIESSNAILIAVLTTHPPI